MFKHIWQVFIYELIRNLRRKGYLFMTFGIPLIAIALLLGYKVITDLNAANGNTPDDTQDEFSTQGMQHVGYIDLSGMFTDTPDADVYTAYADETAARAALDAGDIDGYYVIAADYLDTGEVTLYVPTVAFSVAVNSNELIQNLVFDELGTDIDASLINRLRTPTTTVIEVDVTRTTADGGGVERDFGADFGIVYVFSLALMLGVFTTNGYLLQSVIEEKETRLIEILVSTIRPISLLSGKILAMGVLGMLQIVLWLGTVVGLVYLAGALGITGTPLDNLVLPWNVLPIILLYFVLGYLYFAAAYGAVGALSNSMQEGPQYAVVFTLPAALPFYFLSVFLQSPNDTLPVVLSILPFTSPIGMVVRLVISNVPAIEILLSVVLLALTDVAMIWMAGKLFRVQSLLAGQLPKLSEIPKLLRS
ncbi:MAG: ABC transporter permease [Anaerolineae bacterium]